MAKECSMAQEYFSSDVLWRLNGRGIDDANYNTVPDEVPYYFYGGASGITLSLDFNDGLSNTYDVYRDGTLIYDIDCLETYPFQIDASKMYKVVPDDYDCYIYTGYPINFKDKDGSTFTGTLELTDQYCFYGDNNFKVTATPTRAGYIFKGWYDNPECTDTHEGLSGSISSNPNLTVYALWERDSNADTYTGRLYSLVNKIKETSGLTSSGGLKGEQTIFFSEGSSLPLMVMEALSNSNENVVLDFTSEYEGEKYHFVIKGGTNPLVDKEILWYGPLWLRQYYAVPMKEDK